jgi:GIY-YIG catalytic domain
MLPDDTRVDDNATPAAPVGGIYIIRLSDTHYYGGRTGNFKKRWADHHRELREGRHNNRRMQRVFDIHGRFEPEVVEVLAPSECPDAEQDWLDANFRKPGCVNLVSSSRGGMAGCKATPETIAKRVATFKSRPDLLEKARASIARNGIRFTPEMIRCGVAASALKTKGRKQPPEQVARRVASVTGRKNTPETIERMRVSAKRRAEEMPTTHGADTRALISTQQRGREWVNDGTANRRVWPDEAAALVSAGWVRGKLGGSVAGMVWMIDPTGRRRRVRPGEVDARLSDGWTHPPPAAGYVPVSDSQRGHRGTVWLWRDGDGFRRAPVDEVGVRMADGWVRRGPRQADTTR